MSEFEINSVKYEIVWATDIPARDGIACELRSVKVAPDGIGFNSRLLAEIFRDDEAMEIRFAGFANDVPFAAIEYLIFIFDQEGGKDFMN